MRLGHSLVMQMDNLEHVRGTMFDNLAKKVNRDVRGLVYPMYSFFEMLRIRRWN